MYYRPKVESQEEKEQEPEHLKTHFTEIISDCAEIPVDVEEGKEPDEERKEPQNNN